MKQIIGTILIIFLCSGIEVFGGNGKLFIPQTAHGWEVPGDANESNSFFENNRIVPFTQPVTNLHPRKKSYQLNSLNALKKPLYAVHKIKPPTFLESQEYPYLV